MSGVDLYWIPLGAGGHVVRRSGAAYEWLVATRERRSRLQLFHSALVAETTTTRFTIESAPARRGEGRGVVGGGPVGSRLLGRSRLFRYELRCWQDGVIPDLDEATDACRLSDDPEIAATVAALVPHVPTPVWGRNELRLGEMWNSNSMVSWLIVRAGLGLADAATPRGGRAPGWDAGVRAARDGVERAPDVTM